MTTKLKSLTIACALATPFAAYLGAQVRPGRHPNLAAAQQAISNAIGRIDRAQQANEFDMNGHAAHAKQLLEQANQELNQAAGAANRN